MPRLSGIIAEMFRRAVTPRPVRPLRTRLGVESLEGRDVPVNLTVTPLGDVTEGGTATFRVTRDGSTAATQWFLMNTSGTATSGSDYTALTSSYGQIATGSTYTDVTISTTNDSTSEPTETLTLNVSPYPPATTWSSGTANILDNDAQYVSVAQVSDAAEDGAGGVFRFTRIGNLASSLTANFTVGGTATSGTDFTSIGTTVTFSAGKSTADVEVAAAHDSLYDPDETVSVTVTSGTGYSVGSPSSVELSIEDAPQATFTLDDADEGIWYEVPWGDVDPDEATQSLPLSSFAISVDGELLTEDTEDIEFTTSPSVQFEYGELVGITFAIDTSGLTGFPYTAVSMSAMTVAAQLPNSTILTATADAETFLRLDFNGISAAPPNGSYVLRVRWELSNGSHGDFTMTVFPGSTGPSIRDDVAGLLKDEGLDPEKGDGAQLRIKGKGPGALQLAKLTITSDDLQGFVPPKKIASRMVEYNPAP